MASRLVSKETQFIASLFEVPREIGEASQSEFLGLIASRCAEWFGASTVSFFLAEDGSNKMTLAATGGEPSSIPERATIELGVGIAGIAAQDGVPVLIDDGDYDPKFRTLLGKGRRPLVSSMVVPLASRDGCLGVLNLSRAQGKSKFSQTDLRLAKGVAGHLSLAIDNARLVASLQEALRQNEEERAERDRLNRLAEIGQMTAAIAHEIRNPLTGILSAAQMIREAPEDSLEFARIIEHEAIKLNELCGDFLGFARPVYTSTQPLNLAETIQRVARLMGPQFRAKDVRLDVVIDRNLPMIHGDPLHWEQVLQNLMLNALQASEAGGKVSVGASPSGLWVEDEGCGMSEEQLERLFSPFFTTKPQGTGLGLSNAKKIVDAHGATISVNSRPGSGSRFLISFSMEKAA